MYKLTGTDIELTRGDTLLFEVRFRGRALAVGTEAVFTVKKRTRETAAVIEKRCQVQDNRMVVELTPEDTQLRPGTYWWDIRVLSPTNGEVRTPMEYAVFQVMEVVGNG